MGPGFESLKVYQVLLRADMAELADALDLGSSVFDVGVQVPLSAPSTIAYYMREWLSGRALPCQGRYRGSESRLPLHGVVAKATTSSFFSMRIRPRGFPITRKVSESRLRMIDDYKS